MPCRYEGSCQVCYQRFAAGRQVVRRKTGFDYSKCSFFEERLNTTNIIISSSQSAHTERDRGCRFDRSLKCGAVKRNKSKVAENIGSKLEVIHAWKRLEGGGGVIRYTVAWV